MRDPYDILGVKRGASFDEIKAAYRRACKTRHPDMGGSHEAMVELNAAYAFILNELKQGHEQDREEQPRRNERVTVKKARSGRERSWEQTYRDIDEELEAMRRAAEEREEALRGMRSRRGNPATAPPGRNSPGKTWRAFSEASPAAASKGWRCSSRRSSASAAFWSKRTS